MCLSREGGLGWNHFFALSCQNSHGQGSHRMILQKGHKHKICNKNNLGAHRVILQNDTTISATKMFKQICSDIFRWDMYSQGTFVMA